MRDLKEPLLNEQKETSSVGATADTRLDDREAIRKQVKADFYQEGRNRVVRKLTKYFNGEISAIPAIPAIPAISAFEKIMIGLTLFFFSLVAVAACVSLITLLIFGAIQRPVSNIMLLYGFSVSVGLHLIALLVNLFSDIRKMFPSDAVVEAEVNMRMNIKTLPEAINEHILGLLGCAEISRDAYTKQQSDAIQAGLPQMPSHVFGLVRGYAALFEASGRDAKSESKSEEAVELTTLRETANHNESTQGHTP